MVLIRNSFLWFSYNKMSEHGEKSQANLENLMQQLSKRQINSYDLEQAKSKKIL